MEHKIGKTIRYSLHNILLRFLNNGQNTKQLCDFMEFDINLLLLYQDEMQLFILAKQIILLQYIIKSECTALSLNITNNLGCHSLYTNWY